MVQVLDAPESFGSQFGRVIGRGAGEAYSSSQAAKELARENKEIYQETGIRLLSKDPEMRKQEFAEALRGKREETNFSREVEREKEKFEREQAALPGKYKAQYGAKYEALVDAMKQMGLDVSGEDKNLSQKMPSQGGQENESIEGLRRNNLNIAQENPPHTAEEIAKISFINPTMANTWQRQNEDFYRRKQHEEDVSLGKTKESEKRKVSFHKESQKYDEDLLSSYKKSVNQIESIKNIESAIKSGKIKPGSAANILRGTGVIGDKIANAVLNKDEGTLLSSIPYLIEGWKDIFGVRLSDADLKVIQDKLPDISKSPEANMAVLRVMKKYAKMSQLRYSIGKDIKGKNEKLRPIGYADEVETRFAEMMQPVRIINPKTGNVIEIPAYEVSSAIQGGAKLANE